MEEAVPPGEPEGEGARPKQEGEFKVQLLNSQQKLNLQALKEEKARADEQEARVLELEAEVESLRSQAQIEKGGQSNMLQMTLSVVKEEKARADEKETALKQAERDKEEQEAHSKQLAEGL